MFIDSHRQGCENRVGGHLNIAKRGMNNKNMGERKPNIKLNAENKLLSHSKN